MKSIRVHQEQGLGDALMVAAAAKAVSRQGHRLHLLTHPDYASLLRCCPYIQVSTTDQPHDRSDFMPLDCSVLAIRSQHLVDAYLSWLGVVEPEPQWKSLDLCLPLGTAEKVCRIIQGLPKPLVLIHAAITSPNRTWSGWQALVDLLRAAGITVISVGQRYTHKGVFELDGVVDLVNQLSLVETVAVMREVDLIVSTDSGPLHLAGATETPLLGIFSAVSGEFRMPYRPGIAQGFIQGSCKMAGCFPLMQNPQFLARHKSDEWDYFGHWCPQGTRYGCLKSLSAQMIMEAAQALL